MDYASVLLENEGLSHDFSNFGRNVLLGELPEFELPAHKKTGTTITACVCKDGVVLGADTRATQGNIVAEKNCFKLHRVADNIYAAGAGTAADLDHTCSWLSSLVELRRLNTKRTPRVAMAVSVLTQELFKYQGHKQCAVLIGGIDHTGPSVYKVHPHGSSDKPPFDAMGSGSLSALAVLEHGYKDDMSLEEGKRLIESAVRAGIMNDLGSGGNVDICVITPAGAEVSRSYASPGLRIRPPTATHFPLGTTQVLREKVNYLQQFVHSQDIIIS